MSGRFAHRTIAIVDDDPDILQSIEMAFRHEGAATCTATDGLGGLHLVRESKPDLLVLDMMLPRSSGLLVLEKMKEESISLPVIMVTANQGRRHREFALGVGAQAYLFKPISLVRLLDTAAGLLAGGGTQAPKTAGT
ncbi:MAG: response regulator [Planctomycetaceae bacterium]|jgi:DNA-binding response OmpR family regulator|nr:response regulator [Planctomycetaceae bacterium]